METHLRKDTILGKESDIPRINTYPRNKEELERIYRGFIVFLDKSWK